MAKQTVAKNYVYNLIYQMLTIVMPLIATPYLTRILGAESLGIHGYTLSIVTYFILFGSLGVSMYGQREIAYVQDNKEKRSNIFFELVIIRFITYIIAIAAFYLTFCLKGQFSLFYKILIIEMLANAIDITWYFQGMEDFKKTVIRNMIVKVLGLIFIFVFINKPEDLTKYFVLYVLFDFLGNFLLWFYLKGEVSLKIKKLKYAKHIKPMLLLFLPQVAVQIYTVLDKTMVGKITGNMSEVAYYDQAQKLIRALLLIVTAFGLVMNSRIANSYVKKDNKAVKKYVFQSLAMVWMVATPLMMGVLAVSDKFIPWYLGDDFLDVIPLLNATTPILLAIGLNNVTGVQYLIQVGKQNVFTVTVIVGATLNAVLNFILINKIGVIGAVISSVCAETLILIIQLIYMHKVLHFIDVIKPGFKNIISASIMFVVVRYITIHMPISMLSTLIEALIGAIVYIVMLLIMNDTLFKSVASQTLSAVKSKIKVKK